MHKDTSDMKRMLEGYGITTAEFLYHMPDHPHLLQTFIWQHFDIAPKFPALYKFIDFWQERLDGPLHSVTYTHRKLIAPNEWHSINGEFVLH